MMNWLTDEQKIAILMEDHCTSAEAKKFVTTNNATIYTADELINEMQYWGLEDNEKLDYLQMINAKKALPDWGIVDYEGKTYYIGYIL